MMKLPAWALDAIDSLPGLVSKEEAAKFLGVSRRTISTLCNSGQIGHVKKSSVGSSKIMIPRYMIAAYLVKIKRGECDS